MLALSGLLSEAAKAIEKNIGRPQYPFGYDYLVPHYDALAAKKARLRRNRYEVVGLLGFARLFCRFMDQLVKEMCDL